MYTDSSVGSIVYNSEDLRTSRYLGEIKALLLKQAVSIGYPIRISSLLGNGGCKFGVDNLGADGCSGVSGYISDDPPRLRDRCRYNADHRCLRGSRQRRVSAPPYFTCKLLKYIINYKVRCQKQITNNIKQSSDIKHHNYYSSYS